MKINLTLSDLTISAIINLFKPIISKGFKINNVEFYSGEVKEHHMINLKPSLYKVAEGHNRRPMILLSYNGSSGFPFYENDMFVFEGNTITIQTTDHNDESVTETFQSFECDFKEQKRLTEHAAFNKRMLDDYWKSVEYDMEHEFDDQPSWDYDDIYN